MHSAFSIRHSSIALAAAFLAAHLARLPASLEDLDSINFALGLRQFDVAHHQPHPPGYPVYIAVARLVHTGIRDEAKALGVVSAVAGALAVFALIGLFAHIDPRLRPRWLLAAAAMTVGSPLYWLTAARPLSDAAGLAAAVAIQALAVAATNDAAIVLAAFFAALAIGVRSQVAWLTLPLLALMAVRCRTARPGRLALQALAALVAGLAIWAVPLVMLTGAAPYWHALFDQGAEDLSGIQMLWTTPTPRQLLRALYYAFIAPWGPWPLAAGVLIFAAAGVALMYRMRPRALGLLAMAFGPYVIFDLLFQETFTSRYALPLVAPIAFLAVEAAAAALPGTVGVTLALGAAGIAATIAVTSAADYASLPAPAFRLLADMRATAVNRRAAAPAPVLAMHRREDLDLRRPILWAGAAMPHFSARLAAPPRHEWLELVKYWNGGGRGPVWFVADPQRTDVALLDHGRGRDTPYRWPLEYPVLLGGVRPNEMDWHIFDSPGWYLGEGWSLTPETAGVAEEDRRGPGIAPIEGWIRRRDEAVTLMIGGRYVGSARTAARLTMSVDDRPLEELAPAPGFFLRFVALPPGTLAGAGPYARLAIAADVPRLSIEQFDAQSARHIVFGFAEGWHEMEYNPATGRTWRWASEQAVLRTHAPGRALRLSISGETGGFPRPTRVSIRLGDRVLSQSPVQGPFSLHVEIPVVPATGDETPIVIESDQFFVPAERSRRTQDRRRLALRVYNVRITPAS